MVKIVNEERYNKWRESVLASTDSQRKRDTIHAINIIDNLLPSTNNNINTIVFSACCKTFTYCNNVKFIIESIINDFFGDYE